MFFKSNWGYKKKKLKEIQSSEKYEERVHCRLNVHVVYLLLFISYINLKWLIRYLSEDEHKNICCINIVS